MDTVFLLSVLTDLIKWLCIGQKDKKTQAIFLEKVYTILFRGNTDKRKDTIVQDDRSEEYARQVQTVVNVLTDLVRATAVDILHKHRKPKEGFFWEIAVDIAIVRLEEVLAGRPWNKNTRTIMSEQADNIRSYLLSNG